MLNIFNVVNNLFCWLQVIASGNLCKTGNAWFHKQTLFKPMDVLFKLVIKYCAFRAWTNEAHITFYDIPKLRRLVDTTLA